MQKLFIPRGSLEDYVGGAEYLYPEAPEKCPHSNCGISMKLKKHGFYMRHVIEAEYVIEIKIRRYKCTVCGRTVSMLPAFCVPRFQYGLKAITDVLREVVSGSSVSAVIKAWINKMACLSRRHIRFYRHRFSQKRKILQLVLNEISPAHIALESITGDNTWINEFLNKINVLNSQTFNVKFQDITGKPFMSM